MPNHARCAAAARQGGGEQAIVAAVGFPYDIEGVTEEAEWSRQGRRCPYSPPCEPG